MTGLLLLLGAAAVGGAAWYSYVQAQKRRELFQQVAAARRWSYAARDDSWVVRFEGAPFDEGDDRKARNVMTGAFRDRHMVAFDYSYETHQSTGKGGRSTTVHRYAVAALDLPAPLPALEVVPEGLLGRVGTMLGMQDIELESEDFNRRYRVRCTDPKLAYDVLQPRTMELLLSRPALHLRLSGADAVCWENGAHSPSQLLERLDTLAALVDGIPPYVWSDRRG